VSSVLRPVGSLPPSVYWVRRALVVIVIVLVLALLWWLLFDRGGSPGPVSNPTPGAVGSTSPAPTPSDTPSKTPASSASATDSPTATPTNSATGTAGPCPDSAIKVRVTTDAASYPAGVDPTFTLSVVNTTDQPCLRDVGSKAEELVVTSGQARVWSSDDCNPPGSANVTELQPGQPVTVSVSWGRESSQPGCPTPAQSATAGTYEVTGRVGSATSKPTTFVLQ
jgi:hypothetical protein